MNLVSTYLSEWIQAKSRHAAQVAVLASRIAPIEEELEQLDDKLRELEDAAPTWHDNVVAPILAEIKNSGYKVEPLNDVTVLQLPVMVILPGTETENPKMVNVLFRLEDKTSGDFLVQITGYSGTNTVKKTMHSDNSLSTNTILRAIEFVGAKL